MANISFEVSYSQSDNSGENGFITLNGTEIMSTGRLDDIGDFISADGFEIEGTSTTIECTRVSKKSMRIRIIVWTRQVHQVHGPYDPYGPYGPSIPKMERILESVPINFD